MGHNVGITYSSGQAAVGVFWASFFSALFDNDFRRVSLILV
jgi:hypothetical protein